jgi:GTP-binding protein
MVSAESENVKKEYNILLKELKKYNPELLDKRRFLAITKTDLIDEEIQGWIRKELPKSLDVIFISAVTQFNIEILKEKIWKLINA